MCGILGRFSNNPWKKEKFIYFLDRLRHRGPDDAGFWENEGGTVMLGHRRLSIIDLTDCSHQPFESEDGKQVIVFNGEVYNYLEIRQELERHGYHFRSSGDTEVVLAAYKHWGISCLNYFNGMFAFAIYDKGDNETSERLFVARDRVGKKPFYYRFDRDTFEFASELKAIGAVSSIDLQALNHYLAFGYIPFDLCIAEGVRKLPPGHFGVYDCNTGAFTTKPYWELPVCKPSGMVTGQEFAYESWELLKSAVSLRMRSDVSTGIFLSGGLDSSLIVSAASKVSERPLKTFTISVPGSQLDESVHARLIADHFGVEHHVLELPRPSLEVLDELSRFVDEPLADSSILPTFLVSKLASQHVKVILAGDGGDEVFGGYRRYQQPLLDQHRFGWVPVNFLSVLAHLAAWLPAGVRGRNRIASLRRGVNQTGVWGTPYFDVVLRKRILHPEVIHALGDDLDLPERYYLRCMEDGNDIVDSLMRADFRTVLPDDYLVKVDRASMANSLEVRSPFLDYRIVEYAFEKIPSNWKVNQNERRRVQNLMAKKYLPKSFKLNRKQGFSVPLDEWLREENAFERMEGVGEFLNQKEINNLIKGQMKGRANGSRLFCLMMLALFNQNILKKEV